MRVGINRILEEYGCLKFKSIADDPRFEQNCKTIKRRIVAGAKVISYKLKPKRGDDLKNEYGRTCWIVVEYEKDEEIFKSIWSHRNNQYLRVDISNFLGKLKVERLLSKAHTNLC